MNKKLYAMIVALICIILSGSLFYFSIGFYNQWFLLWIAPIPVLLYSYKMQSKTTAVVAFLSFFVGQLNLLNYLGTELPVDVIAVPMITNSIFFSIIVLVNAVLVKRWNHWASIFLLPSLWTSYEFIVSFFAPSGPLNSLAFSQTPFLSFSQMASITGIWGLTFIIMLFSSGISYGVSFKQNSKDRFFSFACPVGIVMISVIYGLIRLNSPPTPTSATKIGLASIQAQIQTAGKNAIDLTKQYVVLINKLSQQGAKFVVLPEKFVGLDSTNYSEVLNLLQQAAFNNKITLIAGVARFGQQNYNSAVIIKPDGKILGIYNKHHLVPGLESKFQAGHQFFTTNNPFSWGVAICKDMDFSELGLNYGKRHVQLMFVPAFDFNVDAWLHARVAIMRGIENGFTVVRVANSGVLTVSNQNGQILAMDSDMDTNETLLTSTVYLSQIKTIYSEWGNWFGWVSIVMALFLSGRAIYKTRKQQQSVRGTIKECDY